MIGTLLTSIKLGTDISSIVVYGLVVALFAALISSPLFQKFLGSRLPFKWVPVPSAVG
ncbi:GntT/GntP/DsdX family permease [Photorhabdus tasmaniensis]|uniref:GntT/GntP/DsdX family permease n=1 Tax=Photorhabdus tasmaniensis TaxID=1004159 RepID=UPI00404136EE